MSETKSQPTPETDAVFAPCLYIEDITESEAKALLDKSKELEISRDQWKAVAERLAKAVVETDPRYVELFEEAGLGNATKDSIAVKLMREALHEFNQLKESK